MPTRREIREAAAEFLGLLRRGTVAAATATEVTDPSLEDRFNSLDLLNAWLTVDGETRRVVAYDPRTGKVSLARALPSAPTTGTAYALYFRLHPEDWDAAINRGLGRCSQLRRVEITPVAGQEVYTLTPAPPAPHLVEDVLLRRSSAVYVDERPLWFSVEMANGQASIRIRPLPYVDSTMTLVAWVREHYPPLASDTDVTTAPLPLARAAAAAEAALVLLERAPEAERQAWQRLYATALAEWHVQARRYIPPPRTRPQWDLPMSDYARRRAWLPTD